MASTVHVGRWTDWSEGSVKGDRITLPSSNATILIAFIAIFDALVGGIAWNIISFIIHQKRTTTLPRDGLHHQLQALLRNSTEPLSFSTHVMQTGWSWKGRAPQARLRAFLMTLTPLAVSVAFSIAGIASSQISSAGDVLLKGGNCGIYLEYTTNSTLAEDVDYDIAQATEDGIDLAIGNSYAQNCYSNPLYPQTAEISGEYAPGAACGTFVKPNLNYTFNLGNECPFQDACSVPDSEVIRLDTGYLSSHHDLGMNQPPENRVLFRRRNTCSPMTTEGFSGNKFEPVPTMSTIGNVSIYNYGINYNQPTRLGYPSDIPGPNVTFVYSTNEYNGADHAYYLLEASTMDYGQGAYDFIPLPGIANDSYNPISLIFLGNRAIYQNEVKDPWFQASSNFISTVTEQNSTGGEQNISTTFWYNEKPGTVMGCYEQAQFCNPNIANFEACSDFDGWYTWGGFSAYYTDYGNYSFLTDKYPAGMGMNDIQLATTMAIQTAFLGSQSFELVRQLGPQSLLASNYFYEAQSFLSQALPLTQWQAEVANWFSVGLAITQRQFISNWRIPSNSQFSLFWHPFKSNDTTELNMCNSQKVKSTAYQSFSVLGLVINFVIGGLIALGGILVTFVVPRVQKRLGRTTSREQWIANGTLQLQRMAFEKEGLGDWQGDDTVPVTKRGQLLKAPTLGSGAGFKMTPTSKRRSQNSADTGILRQVPYSDMYDEALHRTSQDFGASGLSETSSIRRISTRIPHWRLDLGEEPSSPLIQRS